MHKLKMFVSASVIKLLSKLLIGKLAVHFTWRLCVCEIAGPEFWEDRKLSYNWTAKTVSAKWRALKLSSRIRSWTDKGRKNSLALSSWLLASPLWLSPSQSLNITSLASEPHSDPESRRKYILPRRCDSYSTTEPSESTSNHFILVLFIFGMEKASPESHKICLLKSRLNVWHRKNCFVMVHDDKKVETFGLLHSRIEATPRSSTIQLFPPRQH